MEKLEAKKTVEEIQKIYKEMMGEQIAIAILLMGAPGSGKTTFSCTGRLPILVDCFDPKGSVLFHTNPVFKKLISEGKLLVRLYINEDSQNPTEYLKWEKQWRKDCETGFLKLFGTYVIDTGTTWIESMVNYVARQKGRLYKLPGRKALTGNLEIQDYIPIYNMIMDTVKMSASHGCDFIYVAHLLPIVDDVLGKVMYVLDTYKGLRTKIPKLFSEKYVITKEQKGIALEHHLLLRATGKFEASSQLQSSGKLHDREEPDLKKLLEKAGLPVEDKPLLWE